MTALKPASSFKRLLLSSMLLASWSGVACALENLSDDDLATVTGQSLFNANFQTVSGQPGGGSLDFFRMGLDAEVSLNANINSLKLGCGGDNGAGCDIDIDNLSLSGNSATSAGRVGSDAVITNPFLEFAIKNPATLSTREMMGFRVSADKVIGLLTTGTVNSTVPNGINAISGFMRIQSDATGYLYGKANTSARVLNPIANAPYTINGVATTLNNEITAKIDSGIGAILSIKTVATSAANIPAMSNIPFIRSGLVVNSNRVSSLPIAATLAVPTIKMDFRGVYPVAGTTVYYNPVESPIDWAFNVPKEVDTQGGALTALITGCSGAFGCGLASVGGVNVGDTLQNAFIKATIQGISANVTINQDLGYIHSLPINSPFYLALQKADVKWPNAYTGIDPSTGLAITDIAKKGWWMSFADPINLGSVDPVQPIDIAPLFPQIATQASAYLNAHPATIGLSGLVAAILGTGDINTTVANPIDLSASPLSLTLTDLQLSGQSFAPNCYGGLTFC